MRYVILAILLVFQLGCASYSTPVMPSSGAMIMSVKGPLDIDYDQTKVGSKQGKSEVISILGLFTIGDGSAQAAAENGGLSVINGADYEYFSVLGIFGKFTTVVYGE